MSEHVFYSTEQGRNERQLRILSVGSLVSKPPTKEKRISVKVRMPLSGTSNMGAPAWLDEAYLYVAKHGGDKVTPDIEFRGYFIDLSAENLFGDDIKSPNCIMRGFEISEFGNEETPDVALSFTIRMPFSGKNWNGLGQYVGEDVWARFTPGSADDTGGDDEDGTLLDDGENDEEETVEQSVAKSQEAANAFFGGKEEQEEDPEYDPDSGTVVEMPSTKSGPADLAAFHAAELEKEAKRGRGRPKKVTTDF